jgi:hypothetical protein
LGCVRRSFAIEPPRCRIETGLQHGGYCRPHLAVQSTPNFVITDGLRLSDFAIISPAPLWPARLHWACPMMASIQSINSANGPPVAAKSCSRSYHDHGSSEKLTRNRAMNRPASVRPNLKHSVAGWSVKRAETLDGDKSQPLDRLIANGFVEQACGHSVTKYQHTAKTELLFTKLCVGISGG